MMKNNIEKLSDQDQQRYQILGIVLIIIGILFAQYSYWILKNISLSAFGLSIIMIAITMIFLANDSYSSEIIKSLVEGNCENIETQLNLFEAKERGIYLPPKENKVFAYIPINNRILKSESLKMIDFSPNTIKSASKTNGIIIYLPLSHILLNSVNEKSIEEALINILIEQFKIIQSINVIESNNKIIVKMRGCKIENYQLKIKQILGSFNTMISGSVISYIKNKPLILIDENIENKNIITTFEVIELNE
jgi:hypothetical protein